MAKLFATGYVHCMIDDKQTFPQFAMSCARAFGALVEMRDEPNGAEIPEEFAPSTYHSDQLAEAVKERDRLLSMTVEEQVAFGKEAKEKAILSYQDGLAEEEAEIKICQDMLAKVEAWQPPSDEHTNMKQFMMEQINNSLPKGESYCKKNLIEAEGKNELDFYDAALKSVIWSIDYHTEEIGKELNRTQERNLWIKQLRESLKDAG